MKKRTQSPRHYYEFEVSLFGVQPRPWRCFLIRPNATFAELHAAIQAASGWEESHLSGFYPARVNADPPIAGVPLEGPFGELDGDPIPDARGVRVDSWLGYPGDHCRYAYDFGDGWICGVDFTGFVQTEESFTRRLVAGAEVFPPEDCGGVGGYEALLEAMAGVGEPEEVEGLREWASEMEWSPVLDLEQLRARFDRPKRRK